MAEAVDETLALSGIRVRLLGNSRSLVLLSDAVEGLGADVQRAPETDPIGNADVLVYDEAGEVSLASQGLNVARLADDHSRLVAIRLSPFGKDGPLAGTQATETILQARSGIMAATGAPDDPIVTSTVGLARGTQVLSALLAMAAALVGRERHGVGDHFDLAGYDALLTHLGTLLPGVVLRGEPPPRRGNRHGMAAPWNTYSCADGEVMICTMGDAMWRRLANAVERPELTSDPRFINTLARVANVEPLDATIEEWTVHHPASEVVRRLEIADVPCSLIGSAEPSHATESPNSRNQKSRGLLTSLTVKARTESKIRRQGGLWKRPMPSRGPLAGVRILELASYTAGPMAGWLLGNLGASVLKVEPPDGEGSRRLAQQVDGVGYLYFVNNAGKQACRLDLSKVEDREIYERLQADADVVLTNLSGDTLVESGLDADTVLRDNDLVYCVISGHGKDRSDRVFDSVIQAETGMMDAIGNAVGSPRRSAVSAADVLGAYLAAAGVALATLRRVRTGTGGCLDVALHDAATWAVREVTGPSRAHVTHENGQHMVADGSHTSSVQDLVQVLDDPQVMERGMLIHQKYNNTQLVVTGNHFRSLRREVQSANLAPVNQDQPKWLDTPVETADERN